MMGKLTGGDWERRANEYWDNWHKSAMASFETYMRCEQYEAALRKIVEINAEDFVFADADGKSPDPQEVSLEEAQDIAHAALTGSPMRAENAS